MLDDKDDKKNPSDEYSELSDLFDHNRSGDSLDSLLKDHSIDLGTDADVNAMQDFSFASDPAAEEAPKSKRGKKGARAPKEEPPLSLDDFVTPNNDNLFDDSSLFDAAALFEEPPRKNESSSTKKLSEEPALFESTAFDDVNADFPESAPGANIGEDILFEDYQPESGASLEEENRFPEDAVDAGGEEIAPSQKKGVDVKRLAARFAVMAVLVLVIYGGLKFFLGRKTEPMVAGVEHQQQLATNKQPVHTQEVITTPAKPTLPVNPPTSSEMPVVAPPAPNDMAAAPSADQVAAPSSETSGQTMPQNVASAGADASTTASGVPHNLPVPGSVVSGLPSSQESVTIPATTMTTPMVTNPSSVAEASAMTSVTPAVPGDMTQKLDNLEMALQTLNQRLAQVDMGGERTQRLERLGNDARTPEVQSTLEAAVKKMQALDVKIDRIAALQKEVRHLSREVQALKEDVVTQTNIVGEQQRLFNENLQTAEMQSPGPVKMMVQAAIPGRAWLRSERGELLTVIPGDEVPGYGRVVSIDAASGTVVTSSRAVFREQ